MTGRIGLRWAAVVAGVSMAPLAWAAVPAGPSDVYVQGTQLMVRRRKPDGTLDAARPYTIRGVTWSAATRAPATGPNPSDLSGTNPFPDTIQYGFFFDWPFRDTAEGQQGHVVLGFWMNRELTTRAAADLPIIAQLHANTVRLYSDLGDDVAAATQLLDAAYEQGLMVILTVAASKADLDAGRHLTIVSRYKNHPAVLLWLLGNEWNFTKYFGYTMPQATAATEAAAAAITLLDPSHPVASSLGDRFSDAQTCNPAADPCCAVVDPDSDIPSIVAAAPSVDLWGLNIYRGASFGTLFAQWAAASAKPMFLSEFGTDSFATTGYQTVGCGLADNPAGAEDQAGQASHDAGLWQEIQARLSSANPSERVVGGLIHEFNDELWKVGSFHLGLGNLVDYDGPDNLPNTADDDSSYDEYNQEGYILPEAHPDNVANEERFGLVSADRAPKQAFGVIQDLFAELSTPVLAPIGPKSIDEGQTLSFTVSATDSDGDPMTYSASPLPAGASLNAATGAFAWTPTFLQAGAYSVTFTASDGALSDSEIVAIAVNQVPKPDLLLSAASATVTAILPGDSFTFSHTVKNQGTAPATAFQVAFALSPDAVYGGAGDVAFSTVRSLIGLAVGAQSTASPGLLVPSTTPLGFYYVCGLADSANSQQEERETNNGRCTATRIQVTRSDLIVTAVSGPSAGTRGGSIAIASTIRNQGLVSTGGPYYIGFYLSSDATITTADRRIGLRSVTRLAGGATAGYTTNVTLATTLTPGTYYLGAIADYTNKIIELVETNNARAGNLITIQ